MKKKNLFLFLILSFLVLFAKLADVVAGNFNDTQYTRKEMALFRSEIVPLNITAHHLLPNLEDKYEREEEAGDAGPRSVRTDSYGLVKGADEGAARKATGIVFLGGSTTENNEVDERFRFPYLAPKLLSQLQTRQYYGVNAGVRGHTTQDSLNLYLNDPSPDIAKGELVIVMHNINDRLRLALLKGYKSNLRSPSPLSLYGVANQYGWALQLTWEWIKYKSNILYLIDGVVRTKLTPMEQHGGYVSERAFDQSITVSHEQVDQFVDNLKLLVRVIRARDKTPYLMTQPLAKNSAGQDRFNDTIRSVAALEKTGLVDLDREAENVDRVKLFFFDGIHFNNRGSEWAAQIISKRLLASNLTENRQPNVPSVR